MSSVELNFGNLKKKMVVTLNDSVLISIKPKWCELIASGKKTIEVRRTKPKLKPPFKCYIYCTLPPKEELFTHGCIREYAHELIKLQDGSIVYDYGMRLCCDIENRPYSQDNFLCRKVIGEFVCDSIVWVLRHPDVFAEHPLFYNQAIKDACLTEDEVEKYSCNKDLYGWHISDLVIYDKPKELSEFIVWKKCNSCRDTGYESTACCYDEYCRVPAVMTKPPRTWCYVVEETDAREN